MKLLTLGFWDGKSFIPIDFSIHNEPGKKSVRGLKEKELKNQFTKQRSEDLPSTQRVNEVSKSKIETAVQMIKSAVKKGFVPKYVLADSWFITDGFIKAIKGIKTKAGDKIDAMGLMKTNRIVSINGKNINASLIPEVEQKRIKKCRKLKCNYIVLNVVYKETELKVFFVKMNGQQTWKMLATTDNSLPFIKAMEYYQIRWSIEVFFKDAKQNLFLGKCQSTDFDAQIASISITFMNYIALSLAKRFEAYETMGTLFKAFKDIMLQQNIVAKLWELIIEIYTLILADLGVDLDHFIKRLIKEDAFLQKMINSFAFLGNYNNDNTKNLY